MGGKIEVVVKSKDGSKSKQSLEKALAELVIDRINNLPANQRMGVYRGVLKKLMDEVK